MKRKFILALICCMGMLFGTVYAVEYHTDKIHCWAGLGSENYEGCFVVSGQLLGAKDQKVVSIYVGNGSDVLCMDQILSARDGKFKYVAPIDEDFKSNYYTVRVAAKEYKEYIGTFHATRGFADHTIMTADAEITVDFDGNIPTVVGSVEAGENTTTIFSVSELESGNIIRSNTVFTGEKESLLAENEKVNINYTLPDISECGGYRINIKSVGNEADKEQIFMEMSIDITMELLTVNAVGNITVLNDGYIYAQTFSPVYKAKKITETGTMSENVPKLIFPLPMKLTNFKNRPTYEPVVLPSVWLTMEENAQTLVMFKASDITYASEKRYKITYDPSLIKITEVCGLYSVGLTDFVSAGVIEVESAEDGVMTIVIKGNSVPVGITRTGTVGVMKCKNISGENISTKIEYEEL